MRFIPSYRESCPAAAAAQDTLAPPKPENALPLIEAAE